MKQPPTEQDLIYQIKVVGHLDPAWSEWFEELNLSHEPDGCTVLTGCLVDQAALYGVLIKIRDLGLRLVSVQTIGIRLHREHTSSP